MISTPEGCEKRRTMVRHSGGSGVSSRLKQPFNKCRSLESMQLAGRFVKWQNRPTGRACHNFTGVVGLIPTGRGAYLKHEGLQGALCPLFTAARPSVRLCAFFQVFCSSSSRINTRKLSPGSCPVLAARRRRVKGECDTKSEDCNEPEMDASLTVTRRSIGNSRQWF